MRGRVTVEVIIHTLLGWGRILVRVYIVAYPDVDQSIAKEIKKRKGEVLLGPQTVLALARAQHTGAKEKFENISHGAINTLRKKS